MLFAGFKVLVFFILFLFFINKMFYIFTKTNNLLSEKMKTNYNYPSSET